MSKRYWQILSSRFMVVRLFLLALMMSIIVGLTFPVLTQSPVPQTREELVQQIKDTAALDLDVDKMDVESAIKDFKVNAFGVTEREIRETYKKEFKRLKEAKENDIWEKLPKGNEGWFVAITLAILFAFKEKLIAWLNNFVTVVTDWFYQQFAGSSFLLQFALKRYREALTKKYKDLKIPFRPGLPLPMREIYVPLKVAGSGIVANIEAFEAVKTHRRLMVTGAPGSGKSMLLKSLILAYAEDRLFSQKEDITPILLELNRLSDSTLSIEQHLVEALGRDDFLKATWFVKKGLKDGNLMLLLDGLDELNSNDRFQAVTRIKEFLDTNGEKCRVIITCRTQVYNQEFNQETNQVLEIVEFSDQQIRRFLGAWKLEMPADKSVEQLIQTLRERPRIMALARNPLLLTIIAYLYTDTTFILPHSRSDFYQQATDILLEKWDQSKQQPNQYRGRVKRDVLQVLALYNQDSTNQESQDRRSMDYLVALEQIKSVLPSLNLAVENAEAILNEIVERSGLLLAIDGGQRYQFGHLTLQEFFAAAALAQRSEELVIHFEKDKDAWREVVKLWCGLADQSTELIRAIYAIEPITAFECLADANNVAPDLADQIIEYFKGQLGNGENEDVITSAFGAVAASNRQGSRGESVFKYLKNTLLHAQQYSKNLPSIATALAKTNLPKASDIIAQHYQEISDQNHPLTVSLRSEPFTNQLYAGWLPELFVGIGDLAVPPLVKLAKQEDRMMLYRLKQIRTPNSALALVGFLWDTKKVLANQAAWHLAEILPQPEIEEVFREYSLTEQQKKADYLDWVWSPFKEPVNSALPIIMGRIAYLINQTPDDKISTPYKTFTDPRQLMLDPRLLIPLCVIENFTPKELNAQWDQTAESLLEQRENSAELDQKIVEKINEILKNTDSRWRLFLPYLTPQLQLDLLRRLVDYRHPVPRDWVNIFKQLKYEFQNSWHYRVVLIISFLISIIAIIKMSLIIANQAENIGNWLLGLPIYIVIVFWFFLVVGIEKRSEVNIFMDFGLLGLMTLKKEIEQLYRNNLIWVGISLLEDSMVLAMGAAGTWAVAMAVAWAVAGAVTVVWGGTVAWAGAMAVAMAVAGAGAWTVAGDRSWAVAGAVAGAVAWAGVWAGVWAGAGFLSGLGFGLWKRAEKKEDWLKYLAILAFPWFCTFPIVVIFSTLAMHDFLFWQWPQIIIAWIIIFGTCTALWQRGQELDHDARNPLYGILNKQ